MPYGDQMIPEYIQKRLQRNWGEKADSMDCKVECRLYDTSSDSEWYLYAQNPNEQDIVLCIENTDTLEAAAIISLDELQNYKRNFLQLDDEFRPRNAAVVYEELRKWKES